jgi:uncharacterized protein (DUF4415 family)
MTLEEAKAQLALMNLPPARDVPDEEIDFSDIPASTDEELAQFKRVGPGRPPLGDAPRKMISIKLDQHLLADLKKEAQKLGKPYQSLIHEILTRHFKKRKSA